MTPKRNPRDLMILVGALAGGCSILGTTLLIALGGGLGRVSFGDFASRGDGQFALTGFAVAVLFIWLGIRITRDFKETEPPISPDAGSETAQKDQPPDPPEA